MFDGFCSCNKPPFHKVPLIFINPFQNNNVRLFQIEKKKEFADANLEFDENDRKFSKTVENSVGKGEIARYEQFLHFPHCI